LSDARFQGSIGDRKKRLNWNKEKREEHREEDTEKNEEGHEWEGKKRAE
jgi:hypothetical protein